jgi:ribosome biogenesis GTPase
MRQVRKQIKQNRKPKRPRRRNWMPADLDDLDALDERVPQSERIMPRGERERHRKVMAEALATLKEEIDETEERQSVEKVPDEHGVVIEVSSSLCRVDLAGRSLLCGLRGSLSAQDTGFTNVVAVGDRVVVSMDGADRGIVESVLPRRSVLARPDTFYPHLQQIIVANADQLLVVASWRDPILWFELVDRYLIAAERNNLSPIICVNKIDLAQDVAECRAALQPYLALGYRVLFTSALTGEGVNDLREALQEQRTVLAGMSGVGKSSLLTAMQPGLQLRAAKVSEHSREGRHTTSQVSRLELEKGCFVVDTPGIREFGLSGLRRGALTRFYPDIAAVEGGCRFGDCSHTHEPGCAVKQAVRQGRVSETRYHSYTKIYRALPA